MAALHRLDVIDEDVGEAVRELLPRDFAEDHCLRVLHNRLQSGVCDQYRREPETVASDTLGRSQDVCKGARFPVEGKRCVVRYYSPFNRLEVNGEEEEGHRVRLLGAQI